MVIEKTVKHFISFSDLTLGEHRHVLERAKILKAERVKGSYLYNHLKNRSVGMIFNKNSTRTRVSFECGIKELGGNVVFMNDNQTQFSRGEPLEHSAKVLSRYLAALVIRTFGQNILETLAKHASVPIINALTDEEHPCQILTDILTIEECFPSKKLENLKIAWVGDGNNMVNSWLKAAAIFGFQLHIGTPSGYEPDSQIFKAASSLNAGISLTNSPQQAVEKANVINTDVWTSMGQEQENEKRLKDFKGFQVNEDLMSLASEEAIFLHCLPAHIGEEVSEAVLNSPKSFIFNQAENRLHAQKSLLEYLIPLE